MSTKGILRARVAELERELSELREQLGEHTSDIVDHDSSRVLRASSDYVLVLDADGTVVDVDRLRPDLRREQVIGAPLTRFVPPDERASVRDCLETALAEGTVQRMDSIRRMPDGTATAYINLFVPIGTGDEARVFVVIRNDSDRLQRESALRASERYFRRLATLLPIVLFRTDAEGQNTYMNEHWTALTGQPGEQALGMGWQVAIYGEDRQRTIDGWLAAVRTGSDFEMEHRIRHVDGGIRWVLTRGVPEQDETGATIGWLGSVTDISTQKKTEARLEKAQHLGQLGYWELDLLNDGLVSSEEVRRIFGVAADDLGPGSATFLERVHPGDRDRVSRALDASRSPGAPAYESDFRVLRPDGSIRIVHANAEVVRDEDGEALSMLGTVQDITNQRLLMRELNHRVKNNLAVVVSLARLCVRNATDLDSFSEAFIGRVMAMARAHEAMASAAWTGLEIGQAVELILLAPLGEGAQARVVTSGPPIMLTGEQAMPFCMTLHELTSNALKYGALADASGTIALDWHKRDDQLELRWREHTQPQPSPAEPGMGRQLMQSFVQYELGGELALDFTESGLDCQIRFPLVSGHEESS